MKKILFRWRIILGGSALFGLGLWAGSVLIPLKIDIGSLALRQNSSKYKFTNPLLLCDISPSAPLNEYKDMGDKITALIKGSSVGTGPSRVSVYYRNLNTGRWMGINDNDHYSPASLLKVTTMIAFFKLAEDDPSILQKKIFYDGSFDDNTQEMIKPPQEIVAGNSYTVQYLIERMIEYSDNNALLLLNNNIHTPFLAEVYTDLGITIPPFGGPIDFMSAKSYSYFFRILYNASYLNRVMSERALALLGKADFSKGIKAGVPSGILVAQKFGERTVLLKNNPTPVTRELHDCGIVYSPGHPYLLCVMTEGSDFDKLSSIIRDISKMVYEEVGRG